MQKIKAFTLMELLIGMIISGLVIGFCVMAYFIIFRQFTTYTAVKQSMSTVVSMYTVMENDFSKAKRIKSTNNNKLVLSNGGEKIDYYFTTKYITRKKGDAIDTFHVNTDNWKPVFLLGNDLEKMSLVSKYSFDAIVLEEKESFNFIKNYAADVVLSEELLVNRE